MPPVIVKKRKVKEAAEGFETSRRLAKQVLSQLSYTPTAGTTCDSKVFGVARKLRKSASRERAFFLFGAKRSGAYREFRSNIQDGAHRVRAAVPLRCFNAR